MSRRSRRRSSSRSSRGGAGAGGETAGAAETAGGPAWAGGTGGARGERSNDRISAVPHRRSAHKAAGQLTAMPTWKVNYRPALGQPEALAYIDPKPRAYVALTSITHA